MVHIDTGAILNARIASPKSIFNILRGFIWGWSGELVHIDTGAILNARIASPKSIFNILRGFIWGWSGGAMVLGKLPEPGRPTILITVGQGPIALAVGAGGGWFGHFYSHLSFLLFLPLFGRRLDID